MKMILTATPNASRRTRNRIREHGPVFEDATRDTTGRNRGHVDGQWCVLVRAGHWFGWLPIEEVERTSEGGVKFMWPCDEDGEPQSAGWVCLSNQAWLKELMPTSEELYYAGYDDMKWKD
jgi:hypothetical protein